MARRTFTDESLATLVDETKSYVDMKSAHSNKDILDETTASYTTEEKTKLSGIATGAEVNQNAFSNIVVGSTTVAADAKTDTIEFVGSNVTITPDATNDKITFTVADGTTSAKGLVKLTDSVSSTDTTTAATPNSVKSAYDLANTANNAAATAQSTADSKADAGHTHNYAGSTSAGGAATRAINADTATYATNAGTATYATNSGTATYSSNGAKATSATSATYATTATKAGTATYGTNSGTATYAKTASTATYMNATTAISRYYRVKDANGKLAGNFYSNTAGTTANTGNAYLMIGNSSASSVAGNARGYLRLYDATTCYAQIQTSGANSANRTIIIPNASGTMAYLGHLNRSNGVASANTSYTTYMARGIAASTAALTAGSTTMASGTIYLQYE